MLDRITKVVILFFSVMTLLVTDKVYAEGAKNQSTVSLSYVDWTNSDLDIDGSQAVTTLQFLHIANDYGLILNTGYIATSYQYQNDIPKFSSSSPTSTVFANYYDLRFDNFKLRAGLDLRFGTGENSFTPDEYLQIAPNDIFTDLNIESELDQGFNVSPHIAIFFPISSSLYTGFGLKYDIRNKYDPIEDDSVAEYDPGDKLRFTFHNALTITEEKYLTLQFTYDSFGDNKFDGAVDSKIGNIFNIEAQYISSLNDIMTYAVGIHYKNQSKDEITNLENLLQSEDANSNNNSLELYFSSVYDLKDNLALIALVGIKEVYANGYEIGAEFNDEGRTKLYIVPGLRLNVSSNAYLTTKASYAKIDDKQDYLADADSTYTRLHGEVSFTVRF